MDFDNTQITSEDDIDTLGSSELQNQPRIVTPPSIGLFQQAKMLYNPFEPVIV